MTQILVTGGAGFIGLNLCFKLLNQGYEVIAIDNLITSSGQNINNLLKKSKFRFIKHDITKPMPITFLTNLTKLKYIYHLACPTGVPNIKTFGEEMLLTSSIGTRNILELARKYQAKFLFTSSSEIYGQPEVFPQREDYSGNVSPVGYRSPYEEGKRFSESLIKMYVRKYKLNAVIVRLFNTYGPFMAPDDTRVIPQFIYQAVNGLSLKVHGDGKQKRTFCYIDDIISGLLLVMQKGQTGEVYNLGSKQQHDISDIASKIMKLTKTKSTITYIKRPKHDHQSRLPDLQKVNLLGWKEVTSLETGISKTLHWFKTSR